MEREKLLDEVAEGLAGIAEDALDGRPFWSLEVALLAPGNRLLKTGPLSSALRWVVHGLSTTEDGTDISEATEAHVHVFEMRCPVCQGFHENEVAETCQDCGAEVVGYHSCEGIPG